MSHFVQRLLVRSDDGFLLVEQLEVFRALEAIQQFLLLGGEGIQVGLYVLGHRFVAVGEHVLQAHDAQFGQRRVELGDIAHPVTAVDQAAQAGPAGQCQYRREDKHQAEAQAQFEVDADVAEPAIHRMLRKNDGVCWTVIDFGASCCVGLYRRQAVNLKCYFVRGDEGARLQGAAGEG
jgi:hypothetical protein